MTKVNWIGAILSCLLTIAVSDAVDMTKTERATGSGVVQSVVDAIGDNCIFPNDRLFVRRMAYVESEDGKNSATFRHGFYGGIWQISESKYEATKLCKGTLQEFCTKIKNNFSIDWQQTSWKDLLKPFYSGLAAYLTLAIDNQTVPVDPVEQGKIWRRLFHSKVFKHSRDFPEVANALSSRCNGRADIVFLLDESASVGAENFDIEKDFLVKTVGQLSIGTNNIRVSLVKFGHVVTIVSYLNQNQTNQDVVESIKGLTYNDGWSTETDQGINTVTNEIFSTENGAKETKDAARVLVLITDGQSSDTSETIKAARNAKSNNVEIFSVGVGTGINDDELRQVASKCNQVFTMNTFDDFESFINELTKEACKVKAQVNLGKSSANGTDTKNDTTEVEVKVNGNGTETTLAIHNNNTNGDTNSTRDGQTIVVETSCVVVKVYGSYNHNPSESMYEISGTAVDGRPFVLFVKANKENKPLLVKFIATKLNSTEKICTSDGRFVIKINAGEPKVGEVVCKENGVIRNCTSVDLIESKWKDKICPRDGDSFTIGGNPCTADRLRARKLVFPHPSDDTKFLKCDMKGRVYVITCPDGLSYKAGRESCGTDFNLPDTKRPLAGSNPCTHEKIVQNHMYFPYSKNHRYYIQCDQWGGAWVVPCPDGDVWDQKVLHCVQKKLISPCTEGKINKNTLFPYPGNERKFIECTGDGNFIIQNCGNLVYKKSIGSCV